MRMFLISDNVDTLTGMRLAGIEGVVVHEKNEIKEAVTNVLSNKDIGIILITEKCSNLIPEVMDDIKLNRKFPLLLEIPDRHGSGRRSDFITAYINEAIGIKI
ncbi:MAG: V-type ATP synthase subunit F [Lachnospiraceae bacterium]|nr:V-type ATP synthase subunit F [Lachnospiraceae bacterium]